MTAKEKAQELINRFNDFYKIDGKVPEGLGFSMAKEVVNEILWEVNNNRKTIWIREREGGEEFMPYWREVSNNIEEMKVLMKSDKIN